MISIKTTIRNRRIEAPASSDMPDGTEVMVTIGECPSGENKPLSAHEIASILSAMRALEPLEIPEDVAGDLDAWERKINQHGIDHKDASMEDVFP